MTIFLKKFGDMLSSRQAGKEAYSAFAPTLKTLSHDEEICIDFEGVAVFTPSWGDEFLTPIVETFGDSMCLTNTDNLSVQMTIETLEKVYGMNYRIRIGK